MYSWIHSQGVGDIARCHIAFASLPVEQQARIGVLAKDWVDLKAEDDLDELLGSISYAQSLVRDSEFGDEPKHEYRRVIAAAIGAFLMRFERPELVSSEALELLWGHVAEVNGEARKLLQLLIK
ncbi:MAG: hypothetical protein WD200_03800 [Candidatus Andersenbacteria bacterium]